MPKPHGDDLVLRGRSRYDRAASQSKGDKSGQWPVNPGSSNTHETDEIDPSVCPKKLCSCNAMASRSYHSCLCTHNGTSCWFDGDGCYCKYKGKYCVVGEVPQANGTVPDHAVCPVKTARATVCRIDKDASDTEIRLQCLLMGTEQRCDVMLCQKMELLDDGTYRAVNPVTGSTYIRLRLRIMELHLKATVCHLP